MKLSVIIIDDDPDIRDVLSEFLRLKSINVLATGRNGKEASELYHKHKPDVVLLDLMMPDYDGFYGLKSIREIDPMSKVVILTSNNDEDKIKELTKMGVSIIVEKSRDMNNIAKILNELPLEDMIQPQFVF